MHITMHRGINTLLYMAMHWGINTLKYTSMHWGINTLMGVSVSECFFRRTDDPASRKAAIGGRVDFVGLACGGDCTGTGCPAGGIQFRRAGDRGAAGVDARGVFPSGNAR